MTSLIIITVIIIGVSIYRTFSKKSPSNNEDESLELPLSTKEFVEKYNSQNGIVKGGSLCFYGHWFGRPFDNFHRVETLTFNKDKDSLTFTFNDKESLTIVNPKGIKEYSNQIKIQSADKIFWQWFSYGKP